VTVTHEQIGELMRRLHAARIAWVLCELTGPGWIVSFELRGAVVDLGTFKSIA
jgi:hypothetical protein